MKIKNTYVLDSSAFIAFLSDEKGSEIVTDYISKAANRDINLLLHSVNCLEIYYHVYRKMGKKRSTEIINTIISLPILIVEEFGIDMIKIAGEIKAKYKLSLADSVAISLAKISSGKLLTSDHHEMDIISKKKLVKIKWIR